MRQIGSVFCVLCIILMLLCCSCGFLGDQEYVCEIDKVESVQIVRLEKYVEGEYRYEYTVLSQISNHATFVDQLNDLKHSVNWGEPSQLDVGYVVIKIDYLDGDFDLLYSNAQWFHRSGVNQSGYFFFNKEQFDALISAHLTE